jgi:UDP:flavonoid glycosyltransferase YjiC (YdhE family)
MRRASLIVKNPQHRIAIVCFLPDTGHVLPLLRLARLLCDHITCQVTCFLPSKFESTVRQYGFEYCCLRSLSRQFDLGVAAELSNRSIFYNAFSNYSDLYDRYFMPLREAVSHEFGYLVETMRIIQPHFLLCDSHSEFLDLYLRLSRGCGAKAIINRSEGTHRRIHRPFIQAYGLSDRPYSVQGLVETVGSIVQKGCRCWRVIRHSKRRQITQSMRTSVERRAEIVFKDYTATKTDLLYVTSGLAVLEQSADIVKPGIAKSREVVLAPTVYIPETPLPDKLEEWLARRESGRVVYVCFGTMIALSEAYLGGLVHGFIDAQVSVIWSLPRPQLDFLEKFLAKHGLTENFCVEEYVPQIILLASQKIGCFVTHGGAGSTQEAVVCGKPVLCIPFMWDQPYNCSLLVRLGIGRRLSKRHITRSQISKEIRELLDNPIYVERACCLSDKVRKLQNSKGQSEWIHEVLEFS